MCEVISVILSAIVCCIINLLNFLNACPETSCLLHLMIHLTESPPQPIPPMGAVLLNSAESLFTHKLKHSISVALVPVHSEKQGNYLERAHLGNSAHRRRVGASRKLRAHTEYAEKTFTMKKGGISKKERRRKAAKSFLGGGKPCSFITSWTWRVSSTLCF